MKYCTCQVFVIILLFGGLLANKSTVAQQKKIKTDRERWQSVADSLQTRFSRRPHYERKISNNLLDLRLKLQNSDLTSKNLRNEDLNSLFRNHGVLHNQEGEVLVNLIVNEFSPFLFSQLSNLGITTKEPKNSFGINKITLFADIFLIEEIAKIDDIKAIHPCENPRNNVGDSETEGITHLRIRDVFNKFVPAGSRGHGITVAVISDGVNNIQEAVDSGDLPNNVRILRDATIGSDSDGYGDEGTAMLEIIHDIAQDAELLFYSPFNGGKMTTAILELTNAGADIIVDDLISFNTPWMDDTKDIAAAINQVVKENSVLYVSSAGNYARKHYEGEFSDVDVDGFHDFDGSNRLTLPKVSQGQSIEIYFQWNEEFTKADADFDIVLYDEDFIDSDDLVAVGIEYPTFPYEKICIQSLPDLEPLGDNDIDPYLVLSRPSSGIGIAPSHFEILIFMANHELDDNYVEEGSITANQIAENSITVAAISQRDNGLNNVQYYSSRGNSIIYVYDSNGDPISLFEREKPEITALDFVDVSGAGGFSDPFAGTSAAAPHVAGIAALIRSSIHSLAPNQLRAIIENTAIPIGPYNYNDSGKSKETGHGRIDALNAIRIGRVENQTYSFTQQFVECYTDENVRYGGRNPGFPMEDVQSNWHGYEKQKFENGAIVYQPTKTEAYWLGEGIFNKWTEADIFYSIGSPTTNEYLDSDNNNYATVDFENGNIFWDGSHAHIIINHILVKASPQAILADGQSTAVVTASLFDPIATNEVTFTITSGTRSGQLVGANPTTPEDGQAAITLQATTTPGIVTIEASSPGLTSSSTSVVVYDSGDETEVSGAISENTTWTLAGSPYVVIGDITIRAGVKLTIEPGVTVKLNDSKDIFVDGGLFADGTPNARIIFTANSANPTPGFWGGIQFNEPAIDSICVLNNVVVNFGGDIGQAIDHPIVLDPRVNPTITNTTLQHNRTNGIVVKTGAHSSDILLDITDLPYLLFGDFTMNPGAVLHVRPGVILKMGRTSNDLMIRGGLVAEGTNLNPIVFTSIRDDAHGGDSNGDGASAGAPADWGGIEFRDTVDDAKASLRYCEILYAGATGQAVDYPIFLDPRANPAIGHVSIASSRVNGIGLRGGNFASDIRLDITGLPYVVPNITIRSGASFAIAPGVLLKMLNNADIRVEGGFSATGKSSQHVVFTSFRDDSRGGDTNSDGDTEGSPGDWGGIWFSETSDDAESRLLYCDIYFGGQGGPGNFDAPIELDARANPRITNVKLEQNRLNGIDLRTGTYRSDVLLDLVELPYMIRRDLTVDASATMRIAPGVLLKFGDKTDFYIRGGLIADGAIEAPIVFTSLRDDNRDGDTNGDDTTVGAPGDWGGIRFEATTIDGNAVLRNCEIYFAGQGGSGNNNSPIVLDARANPIIERVALQDNRVNGIWLLNQTYQVNIDLDITELPYILGGDFAVGASAELRIHPGALFKMGDRTDFFVDGTFKAIGAPGRPVIFTSFNDDRHGGDTDGNGVTNGVPGDWGGIRFRDASNDDASVMDYTEIYFAGQGGFSTNGSPLVFDNASPKIQNLVVSDTRSHGIHCVNSASPDLGGGARGSLGGNRLLGFVDQSGNFAVFNNGVADVFAKFNYWATADTTLIDAMIFDAKDDAGKGKVFYQPFVGAVTLTNFAITPFPAEVNSPITFSGTIELNGQAQQVEVGVEDPVSLATRIVPVQPDGSFSYTTSLSVSHVDTYLFNFGAFGSNFETVVIPTIPFQSATNPNSNQFNIPLLSAKLAFEVGKLGRFIGVDSPINILGEKINLSGASKTVEEEILAEFLSAQKEYFKQFSNNLEFLYKERNQMVLNEGVTALATILAGGGIDLRGIVIANAEIVSEAVIVSLVQTVLNRVGQDSPEVQEFLKKPGIIVSLVSMQARHGINKTQVSVLQALLSNNDIEEITIQDIEPRFDGSIISLIIQLVSKAGERFGIVIAEHGTGNMVSIIGKSPIDLIVTDPEGRSMSKEIQEVPRASYAEVDIDGDGEIEDEIVIFDAIAGNYSIEVVPEPNANPNDTFSLLFVGDTITTVLAQDVAIQDIPAEPYNTDYTTHVSEPTPTAPTQFVLAQNYPNPFNPTTTIEYRLPKSAQVTLKIYNIRGQEVRTLVDEEKPAGVYKVTWDGKDAFGRRVSSGIYVYQMRVNGYAASRKLVLLN